jgi:hypothetical protein
MRREELRVRMNRKAEASLPVGGAEGLAVLGVAGSCVGGGAAGFAGCGGPALEEAQGSAPRTR